MNKWIYYACLLLLLCVAQPLLAAPFKNFISYNSEAGLAQNSVNCFVQDQFGFLWLGTQDGLSRFDGYQFENFYATGNEKALSNSWVSACIKDQQQKLWFATSGKGLNLYDDKTKTFTHFNQTSDTHWPDNRIWSAQLSETGILWLGTEQGHLIKFNPQSFVYHVYQLPQPAAIRGIAEHNGIIWLGTSKGVAVFSLESESFKLLSDLNGKLSNQFVSDLIIENDQLWLATKSGVHTYHLTTKQHAIPSLFKQDLKQTWVIKFTKHQQKIYLSTYGKGLFIYDRSSHSLSKLSHIEKDANSLRSNYIISSYIDDQANLYVGTDGAGFSILNHESQLFNHNKKVHDQNDLSHNFVRAISRHQNALWVATRNGLNLSIDEGSTFKTYLKEDGSNLPANNIFALLHDTKNSLWLGTYGGGLATYLPQEDQFKVFNENDGLVSNYVYSLANSDNHQIWVGGNQGVMLFDEQQGVIDHFHEAAPNPISNNTIFSILQHQNTLWLGTRLGLNKINLKTKQVEVFNTENGLSDNWVTALHLDHDNTLWVGTYNGLNKLTPDGVVTQFTRENGLSNSNIFAIEGTQNMLWLATNQGIQKLDKTTLAIEQLSAKDGLQGNAFILGASHQSGDTIYMGGTNGFNAFNQYGITKSTPDAHIKLTGLSLLNQPISIFDDTNTLLNMAIEHPQTLSLAHDQNIIEFSFSALAIHKGHKLAYQYRLKGFDEKWVDTNYLKRFANYTNLAPGQYQFQVKYSEDKKHWSKVHTLSNITITPPLWRTWWAYMGYASVLLGLLWLLIQFQIRQAKAQAQVQNAFELVKAKEKLLADVAHEFRTPLSLIMSPLGELNKTSIDEKQHQLLTIAQQNTEHLSHLVSQILALNEFNHHQLCHETAQNITQQIEQTIVAYTAQMQQRGLTAEFDSDPHIDHVIMVKDSIKSLINNLLSNAVKYATDHSKITISLTLTDSDIKLTVSNLTQELNKHDLDSLCQRFTRCHEQTQQPGTGLGLYLVSKIAKQHQSELTFELDDNHLFTVNFLLPQCRMLESKSAPINPAHKLTDRSKNTILLVEDNAAMQSFLASSLSPYFQVVCATNGAQAKTKLSEFKPDLVISDLMMPVCDGIELLTHIRNTQTLCDLPFILITANSQQSSKISAYQNLADDFIEKPFTLDDVISRINKLIQIRQLVAQTIQQHCHTTSIETLITTSHDKQTRTSNFLEQVNQIISKHAMQPRFNTDELAKLLHISQRTLQLKLKEECNEKPNDLIRLYRLACAKKLITETHIDLASIALQTGFSSHSYFSSCFKNHYKLTPSQLREKNKNKQNQQFEK